MRGGSKLKAVAPIIRRQHNKGDTSTICAYFCHLPHIVQIHMGKRVKRFCFADITMLEEALESNGIVLHCRVEQVIQAVQSKIGTQLFNLNPKTKLHSWILRHVHAWFAAAISDVNKSAQVREITVDDEKIDYLLHVPFDQLSVYGPPTAIAPNAARMFVNDFVH